MALQAMWVHGSAAGLEFGHGQQGDPKYRRYAKFLSYKGANNQSYWFHFAIPTPVILNGVRTRMRKVMVLFDAGQNAALEDLAVHDGPNQVFYKSGLKIGGNHLSSLTKNVNSFDLPDSEVYWGVNVSTLFRFADPGEMWIAAAGIDLEG